MRVVVVGRNYSSLLGMIRAVGLADYSVTVVRIVKKITRKTKSDRFSAIRASKYVVEQFFSEQDREALMNVLLGKCAKKSEMRVILPTDDFAASTIDLNYDSLKEYFYVPNIRRTQGEIVRIMDKNLQKSIAEQAGLNVAKSWVVNIKEGKYTIPEGIEYPVFTKPEISMLFNKKCMKRCNDESELSAVLDDVASQADCPLLVEQFMEIGTEYAVLGASDGTNSVIPGIITVKSMGSGAHKGVTLRGCYSSLSEFGDLKQKLQKLMKNVCFTGLFDVDLYESNGEIYFCELNLRMGASGFVMIRAGINLPKMIISNFVNHVEIHDVDFCDKISFINEKVNLDDYANGFISWKQYQENERTADYGFIKDTEDPKPYRAFKIFVAKARLISLLKKLRK